jgi:hypothetical protein
MAFSGENESALDALSPRAVLYPINSSLVTFGAGFLDKVFSEAKLKFWRLTNERWAMIKIIATGLKISLFIL